MIMGAEQLHVVSLPLFQLAQPALVIYPRPVVSRQNPLIQAEARRAARFIQGHLLMEKICVSAMEGPPLPHTSGRENAKGLLAISNCGFPEAHQNVTALAICRQFAEETGMEWIGGLALGGGQSIDGRLEKLGRLAGNLKKSLDLAAAALVAGKPLPEKAEALMAMPLMPKWFYLWMAKMRGRRTAIKNGVWGRINDRPYLQ